MHFFFFPKSCPRNLSLATHSAKSLALLPAPCTSVNKRILCLVYDKLAVRRFLKTPVIACLSLFTCCYSLSFSVTSFLFWKSLLTCLSIHSQEDCSHLFMLVPIMPGIFLNKPLQIVFCVALCSQGLLPWSPFFNLLKICPKLCFP